MQGWNLPQASETIEKHYRLARCGSGGMDRRTRRAGGMKVCLVNVNAGGYTRCAAEKEAARRGTLKFREREHLSKGGFRQCAIIARLLQWAGLDGDGFGRAGDWISEPVFQPYLVPALPFGTGKRF